MLAMRKGRDCMNTIVTDTQSLLPLEESKIKTSGLLMYFDCQYKMGVGKEKTLRLIFLIFWFSKSIEFQERWMGIRDQKLVLEYDFCAWGSWIRETEGERYQSKVLAWERKGFLPILYHLCISYHHILMPFESAIPLTRKHEPLRELLCSETLVDDL